MSPILARAAGPGPDVNKTRRAQSGWSEACPLLSPQHSWAHGDMLGGQPSNLQLHFLLCLLASPLSCSYVSPGNPPPVPLPPCTGLETATRLVPKDSALPLPALGGPTLVTGSDGETNDQSPGPVPSHQSHSPGSTSEAPCFPPHPAALSPQAQHPGVLGRMGGDCEQEAKEVQLTLL